MQTKGYRHGRFWDLEFLFVKAQDEEEAVEDSVAVPAAPTVKLFPPSIITILATRIRPGNGKYGSDDAA
ncbi:hypothetical protein H1R20_g1053, partial [Candolleomyces eurysporus]